MYSLLAKMSRHNLKYQNTKSPKILKIGKYYLKFTTSLIWHDFPSFPLIYYNNLII